MIGRHRNQLEWMRQWRSTLFLLVFGALAHAQPVALDRSVASIEGRVITWSQLQFEARVLLIAGGGVQAAFADLDQQALDSSLRAMVDQRLALVEADKLEAYPLEAGELEASIAAFRTKFPSEERFAAFLDAHEADLNDLAEVLRRSLRAQRALEGKLRLRAQVNESDARAYQAEHKELKAMPLENVRSMLMQQRFGDLVKKELAEQRRTVDVRLLGPFSPKAGR